MERVGGNPGPVHRRGLPLTFRQRQILDGYARGLRTCDVARVLGITHKTIEGHLGNAKARLGARTVTQAVALYVQQAGTRRPRIAGGDDART